MDTTNLVSIILPCYNAETYIEETIRSVLNQSYTNWELIIVNDGSTDCTVDIIHTINDHRIFYYYQENKGASVARNFGLSVAKGHFIGFLDADDRYEKDNLKKKVDFLLSNPEIDIVTSSVYFIDENSIIIDKEVKIDIDEPLLRLLEFRGTIIWNPTTLVLRKKVAKVIGFFDTSLVISEDWDYWRRMVKLFKIGLINEKLIYYRIHDQQITKNIYLFIKNMKVAFQKANQDGDFIDLQHKIRCYANLYLIFSGSIYRINKFNLNWIKYLLKSFFLDYIPVIKRIKSKLIRN